MREAMAKAPLGDDVYGEDPTVNKLQEMAAHLMGQEAGLFVPSGTMGNLAAMLTHCQRGDEVIVGRLAHTFLYEAGGVSALGGIHSCQLPNQSDGSLDINEISAAIREDDAHEPVTRLICLENTHNHCGGVFQTADYTHRLVEFAHALGIKVHLDGARIFNAAVAQGIQASVLAGGVDSVTFCISKGLCAPVGSVLCGSKDFIKQAHRVRKMLGGGMRQAGIMAAAGIIALEKMIDRLKEDHIRARRLADGLREISGLKVQEPVTNMVFIELKESITLQTKDVQDALSERGIQIGQAGSRGFRLVLHFWITDEDVSTTVRAFKEILSG
jgi:threonine aldolase